jgi:hypothetical protein
MFALLSTTPIGRSVRPASEPKIDGGAEDPTFDSVS